MKCNEKKTAVLTKEEKKTLEILNYYDCHLIEGYGNLVYALEQGEYVIGGSIYPLELKSVLHYDNGRLDILEVEPSDHIHPKMAVKRLRTTITKHNAEDFFGDEDLPIYDDYFVSYKNNLLDLSNIPPINHKAFDEMLAVIKKHEDSENLI